MTIYVNTRLLCRSIAFSFFTVTISNTTFPNSPRILRLFNKNLKDKKKTRNYQKNRSRVVSHRGTETKKRNVVQETLRMKYYEGMESS